MATHKRSRESGTSERDELAAKLTSMKNLSTTTFDGLRTRLARLEAQSQASVRKHVEATEAQKNSDAGFSRFIDNDFASISKSDADNRREIAKTLQTVVNLRESIQQEFAAVKMAVDVLRVELTDLRDETDERFDAIVEMLE